MQSVAPTGTYSINDDKVKIHPCENSSRDKLDDMIAEYQLFHERWIEGLKKLRDKESAADGASKRCVADNGNANMVSVWHKYFISLLPSQKISPRFFARGGGGCTQARYF